MPPTDISEIDSVLDRLDVLLDEFRQAKSRLGYFAAMYRRVTRAVKSGILAGDFDDDVRMSHFDRLFAEHYFDALTAHRANQDVPAMWRVAFEATATSAPLVLQHLLLGMNAHINVDLGIAATEVAPGQPLAPLRGDFDRINAILASLIDTVQTELSQVSPWLGVLDTVGGRCDEMLTRFDIELARDGAWRFAERLANSQMADRAALIAQRTNVIAALGRAIAAPRFPLSIVRWLVRRRESDDVLEIIDVLSG